VIVLLSRKLVDPLPPDPTRPFDTVGAILSAVGMLLVVVGILQAGDNGVLMVVLLALGAAFLFWFFLHIRARERAGKEPLLSTSLFRNRTSNLGLVTQNIQWLLLIGLGLGVMLTPSVNVVQSAFPEDQQGEISGLSRSVFTLGSSLGTAIAGTILVSDLASGNRSYALAMASLAVIGLIGQVAAIWLPPTPCRSRLDGRRAQGTVDGPATVLASSARVSGRRPCRRSRRTLMPGRPRCGGTAWTR
jgi:Na+/melibiose symporter-like transporter